jgi:serine phosphatase RsbU (regulator of sigma subunit)/ActR/RegA family two-component response regulator
MNAGEIEANRAHRAMLANLRHELRTPLNAIIGYSEMLLEDAEAGGQTACLPDLSQIHAAGRELLELVNRILDPARVEAGKLDMDLAILATALHRELLTPAASVIGYTQGLLGDAGERGAADMAPDLEKILLAARRFLELIGDDVHFPRIQAGDTAAAAAEIQEAVRAVHPLVDDAPSSDEGGRGKLLVVDDNALNRDLLERYLQRQGHDVVLAENGRQALERVRQEKFDLILLDMLMPELNGYEVLQRLKSDAGWRDIPVIMISALDEIESVARCIEAGAEDYLPKPFNPVLLRARISACLEKKRFRDLEVDYLRNVALITDAALAVEAGTFEADHLVDVAGRADALGHLARVFQQMVREMQAREQRAKEEEALKRELRLASEIQVSMLPAVLPRPAGLDIGACSIPAKAVGGDFFDVFALGAGRLGFAIGDVAGKGIPAALFTALTCALLRVEAMRTASPERVLWSVNRHLLDRNSRGLFVTLLYGVLDEATRRVTYVRAGHEFPLLYDRGGALVAIPEGRSLPLGLFSELTLEKRAVTLRPGDTMLLYTDGVTDARNEQGELFGLERLERCLGLDAGEPAQATCDRLVQTLRAYQGQAPQADDITLMAIRALG